MEPLLVTFRCLLAAVFAVAGVAKLADLSGSRRAIDGFGVPARVASVAAVALPGAEVGIAAALLVGPSARYGAIAALALVTTFIAGIRRANAQGRMPDCHCFGQLQSEPAGPSTIMRNLILAAIAVPIIVVGPWVGVSHGFHRLSGPQIAMIAFAAAGVVVSLAAAHFWGEARRVRRELAETQAARQPAGLPRGVDAPEFELAPIRGPGGSLRELQSAGRPAVLVFVSTMCQPCLELLPQLAGWQESLADALALPAIFTGQREEMVRLVEDAALTVALAQEANEIFELYGLRATPSAVAISSDGTISSGAVEGAAAIEALVRSVIARRPESLLAGHQA